MLTMLLRWREKRALANYEKKRNAMIGVITKHGLKAHKYFPGVKYRHDMELWSALDWLAAEGFLITDASGEIAGKVSTANLNSNEIALIRRSQIKLVDSEPDGEPPLK